MVILVPAGASKPQRISGVLIDVNDHGFRVRHQYDGFKTNDLASFLHRLGEGVARVIWSKNIGADFETGFSYLEE